MRTAGTFILGFILVAFVSCGGGGSAGDAGDVAGDSAPWGFDRLGGADLRPSGGFSFNSAICTPQARPSSACSTGLQVPLEALPGLATALEQQGLYTYLNKVEVSDSDATVGSDSVNPADVVYLDLVVSTDTAEGPEDVSGDGAGTFDVETQNPWIGRPYLLARDGLGDLVFVIPGEGIVVASWCPAEQLGQIRRLDALLARTVRAASQVMGGLSYKEEAVLWAEPAAYYTPVAGMYQRSYMNSSLDINEPHHGGITMGAKPTSLALVMYGEADRPSTVGDVVGAESVQIGHSIVVENDTVTVTGEVVRLWNLSLFAGIGEIPVMIDLFVADASISFNTGTYRAFMDGLFNAEAGGSLVLSLQGASPGKLLISRSMQELDIPPPTPVL